MKSNRRTTAYILIEPAGELRNVRNFTPFWLTQECQEFHTPYFPSFETIRLDRFGDPDLLSPVQWVGSENFYEPLLKPLKAKNV